MYRIPKELDLSPVVGTVTTQLRVGQFDLQFTFGDVTFLITSSVNLHRAGKVIAHWEGGKWPDPSFYEIMNTDVIRCEVVNDSLIVIEFENGIVMHLVDEDDGYEAMEIRFKGNPIPVII